MNTLQDYESIYNYPIFNERSKHRQLCELILEDKSLFKQVQSSMRVFMNDHSMKGGQAVSKSIQCRVPVYYGKNMTDMFSTKRLKEIAGYTVAQAHAAQHSDLRYAITGRILATTSTLEQSKFAYACHVWGINFETTNTKDYKVYTKNGRILRPLYKQTLIEMIMMMYESALHAMQDSKSKSVDLLLPLIGMGEYMSAIENQQDRDWALGVFVVILNHISKRKRYQGMKVYLHDYSSQIDLDLLNHLTIRVMQGSNDGDMFKTAKKMFKTSPCLCLVNAYDSVSMIGNGQIEDNTIDGMLVAGASGGAQFSNSSFVHNPFLIPIILKKSSWRTIPTFDSRQQESDSEEEEESESDEDDVLEDQKVWARVVRSGNRIEALIEETELVNRTSLLTLAKDYVKRKQSKWKIAAPRSWSPDSGPHVTLAPSMKKFLNKRIRVTLGQMYSFEDSPSRWVVIAAKIADCYDCGEFECCLSIGQQYMKS